MEVVEVAEEPLQKLRDAFKALLTARMKADFERGVYDEVLLKFINGEVEPERGDTISIMLEVQTVPDDIVMMRILAGYDQKEVDKEVMERVMGMWRKSRG